MVPALAVADALRADGAEVSFVGGERAEAELVPAAGYPFTALAVEGLSRTSRVAAARAALKAVRAVGRSLVLLRRVRPDAVMGGGGYVAAPVGIAAVLLRIPLVLTEADSHLGLANRLLARFARRVCLALPIGGRDGTRYLVTGRPVPPPCTDRAAARAQFGIEEGETCVLVFGGSLGARSVNDAAIEGFSQAPFHVIHACGERDHEALLPRVPGPALRPAPLHHAVRPRARGLRPGGRARRRLDLRGHRPRAAGDPRALPARHRRPPDGQRALDGRGGRAAVIVPDEELTPERLAGEVAALLSDPGRLAAMARASASLARPEAAAEIAGELRRAAGA